MHILPSIFYKFMSFLPANLYKTAHKLGIKQKYIHMLSATLPFFRSECFGHQMHVLQGGPTRHSHISARNSVNLGSRCQGSAALKASEQNSVRELNDCHYNTRASVFGRSALLHFCSQEEHKNKFLPSSPRRLTSS